MTIQEKEQVMSKCLVFSMNQKCHIPKPSNNSDKRIVIRKGMDENNAPGKLDKVEEAE